MLHFNELENLISSSKTDSSKPPYILCNEAGQEQILTTLTAEAKSQDKRVHLGFSVWFNLDVIAVTHPEYAIILDIDPNVHAIYQCIKKAIDSSKTRDQFVDTFLKAVEKIKLLPFPMEYQKNLFDQELSKKQGFLSSEKNFSLVKAMHEEGKIFFGAADVTNSEIFRQLAGWCKTKDAKIDTLYISNISEWLDPEEIRVMKENLGILVNQNTRVIDAFYPTTSKDNLGPPLRITYGEAPSFTKGKPKKTKPRRMLWDSDSTEENEAHHVDCKDQPIKKPKV